MTSSVFDSITMRHTWTTDELREIFSEENKVQKWLDFEAAFSQAQASLGIIPQEAADTISANAKISNIDIPEMAAEMRRIKHSLVPMLKQLIAHCGEHGQWVHYGPTTQDVLDTATVLQLREAHQIFLRDLKGCGRELARLAKEHRDTVMVGRTHGVQALPITFGHKCAVWLDEVSRHYERMRQVEPRLFVGMLIGAVGSQASLGEEARQLEEMTCNTLGLAVPDISWGPARDRFAEYANLLAMVGATFSKIGNELFNMQRNEFAEVEEGFSEGKLGSSTMPHKRNPTLAENVAGLTRALRYNAAMMTEAMVQEHERDGIAWKSEWKALPECCLIAGAILLQSRNLLAGLRVDTEAMAANLDMMRGYLLSERVMLELGKKVGKDHAHHWVYEASMRGIEQKLDFRTAMHNHAEISKALTDDELTDLTQPANYLGQVGASIDRTLATQEASGWMRDEAAVPA